MSQNPTTQTPTYHCGCGAWTGESCAWSGPLSSMVIVEYMPEQHRDSHGAAGNSGSWPANGSVRVAVYRDCADMLLEDDAEWSEIIDVSDPAEYALDK